MATRDNGLVTSTFGNVSAADRDENVIVIKPSGVDYDEMTADSMVVTDLDGAPLRVNEGALNPSSDLVSHVELYRAFPEIGCVVHTHSTFATVFAQLKQPIPPQGTTHADYFRGTVPVTRDLTEAEVRGDYVRATGAVIVERFRDISYQEIPAVLVAGHGPFVWGATCDEAITNATMLEEVAKLAWHAATLVRPAPEISHALLDRHYFRKHGSTATYGQNNAGSARK